MATGGPGRHDSYTQLQTAHTVTDLGATAAFLAQLHQLGLEVRLHRTHLLGRDRLIT